MAVVRQTLDVPGLLRRRATLLDEDGRTVAALRRGVRGSRFARATDPEGADWTVARGGDRIEIRREGELRATVVGSELTVGDRAFVWRLAEDGSREAQVTARPATDRGRGAAALQGDAAAGGPGGGAQSVADDGARDPGGDGASGVVLRIRPPLPRDDRSGDLDAWAIVEIDDDLPEAFGVVLAASARLLQVGGSGHWTPPKTGNHPGPSGSDNGDNIVAAARYGSGAGV